ncbi:MULTISPECIES: outer membrane protein [Paracoccus]|jgi:opacity protein-like surface antigen|uniref:outer membrane protein n=1 Tax=Paracoccus TaxID=265 RepID=UPI002587EC6A|nr:outer membrane beta-barrel protein [Paracoccus sp. (in: a-proteobacteria)]
MSNRIALILAATTFLASPAFSGGYVAPVIQPQISPVVEVARPAFSWTGPYVGAYIGNTKLDLKSTGEIHHDAITVEHDEITEEIPAEVIEHPEVTEDRVVEVIEHPEVTEEKVVKEIDHPAIVEKIPAVTKEHPEVKEKVTVGWEEVQIGTETVKVREDVYRDENGEKQRDENHHTGWRHVPVYEEVPVYENRPIYEERVVQDAWVEVISPEKEVVIKDAWTETVTETVVVQEAWVEEVTETVVVQEARTEIVKPARTVVVQEAWTEVVREAWTEQLTDSFSEDGNSYGLFAGYRRQWQNNFVGGIEIHYGRNGSNQFNLAELGGTVQFGKDTYGAELQAGYAIKRALPYIAVGYANILDQDAMTVSLGLDYAVTDRLIVGAKYTHYDIGDISGIDSIHRFEGDGNMVSLRAAIKF